jgi:4-amino-4-deoxy-L-arabinose transferase-like glycosyltransferase
VSRPLLTEDFWRRPGVHRALLALAAAGILFARLGDTHLANYDDCFYAQKAKEMLHAGDWLTPRWAGELRVENPPLFLWLMMLSFLALGVTNYAAILPSALAGVLCVVLVHRLAEELEMDSFAAWGAAFVLVTTQYFMKFAKHAMFDVFLTMLFVLALLAYRRALAGRRGWYLVVGLCTGAGILSKSVMGLFPLAVIVLHLLWTRRARELARPWFWAGVGAALVSGFGWYAYQLAAHREAVLAQYGWLILSRAAGAPSKPTAWWNFFDYGVSLARNYWPWAPLALAGLVLAARRAFGRTLVVGAGTPPPALSRDAARLLLVWLLVTVGVMSLAREKKLWYIMAAFPGCALLAAAAAAAWLRGETARHRVMRAGYGLLALLALALNLLPVPSAVDRRPDLQAVAMAARDLTPAGRRVLNLDAGYHSTNAQFLFYSDRSLTEPLGDPAAVRRGLDAGSWALLTRAGYAAVAGADSARYPVVMGSGGWRLVKAAPSVPVVLTPGDRFR